MQMKRSSTLNVPVPVNVVPPAARVNGLFHILFKHNFSTGLSRYWTARSDRNLEKRAIACLTIAHGDLAQSILRCRLPKWDNRSIETLQKGERAAKPAGGALFLRSLS